MNRIKKINEKMGFDEDTWAGFDMYLVVGLEQF